MPSARNLKGGCDCVWVTIRASHRFLFYFLDFPFFTTRNESSTLVVRTEAKRHIFATWKQMIETYVCNKNGQTKQCTESFATKITCRKVEFFYYLYFTNCFTSPVTETSHIIIQDICSFVQETFALTRLGGIILLVKHCVKNFPF